MADAVTRRAEDFGGWAIVSAAPAAALLAFLLVGGWWGSPACSYRWCSSGW